jgi:capsular polysaccharide biosynthesis protein
MGDGEYNSMMGLESEHRRRFTYGEEAQELSLRDISRTLMRRLWVIVMVVVVFTGAAVGYSLVQTPKYEASAKILVSPKQGQGDVADLSSDVQGLQQLIKTFTVVADTRPTAEAVIERLNSDTTPDNLLNNFEAQQVPETQLIQVTYEGSKPERVRSIANTSGEVLSEMISDGRLGSYAVTAKVLETAETPTDPVSPKLTLNIFMALVVGSAFGIALVFLMESLGVGTKRKKY